MSHQDDGTWYIYISTSAKYVSTSHLVSAPEGGGVVRGGGGGLDYFLFSTLKNSDGATKGYTIIVSIKREIVGDQQIEYGHPPLLSGAKC